VEDGFADALGVEDGPGVDVGPVEGAVVGTVEGLADGLGDGVTDPLGAVLGAVVGAAVGVLLPNGTGATETPALHPANANAPASKNSPENLEFMPIPPKTIGRPPPA